ncbi:FAAR078Wp [Eremothecium gossypii FDAG1]|nr:FAAR078Wp [Eremothecium gossypii FDAG1]
MLSSTTWVPRGFASEFPEKYELDDAEMARINELAQLQLDDAEEGLEEAGGAQEGAALRAQLDGDDDLKEYDLEHYDEEDAGAGAEVTMFPGLSGEARFHEGEEGQDAYLSLPTVEEEQEERAELQVYPTDNLVLATRTEDDISYLDVYVYDDGAGFHDEAVPQEAGDAQDPDVARGLIRDASLYVHHDLMLPAFPLCVEWVNYRPGSNSDAPANFAAVGTFDPTIELWNLDCVDRAFPDMILGEPADSATASKKSKKKKKGKKQHVATHHTDAVLSLAHNRHFRAVLASTSADHTVKLWDLNHGRAARSLDAVHSATAVSSSQWHPSDGSILLTAGYDSRVALSDVRIANDAGMSKYWKVMKGEEIESATFVSETVFLAGTDSGNVYSFDLRNGEDSAPLWTLNAHDSGISSLSVSPSIPNMLVTSAMGEKVIKLWKTPAEGASAQEGPRMVLSRDFGVGNVLSTSFAPDVEVASTFVVGGTSPGLKLWDAFTNRTVRKSFASELQAVQQRAREEAKQLGKASRIARKYISNSNPDTVVTVDDNGSDEEEQEGAADDWEDEE